MKNWQQTLFGLMLGLCLSAGILIILRTPGSAGILLAPPPTALPLMVHVTGEVNQPGVYQLPRGSRVVDAIESAGGFTSQAAADSVNQAEFLQDGSMIFIAGLSEFTSPAANERGVDRSGTVEQSQVNINTATAADLEMLPGIGEKIAQDIITYRSLHGLFVKIDDIMNVPGVGEGIFKGIKDLIVAE